MPLRPEVLASLTVPLPAPEPPEDAPAALYGPEPPDCPDDILRLNLSSGVSTEGLLVMLLPGRARVDTWMLFLVPSSRRLVFVFLGCLDMAPTWMLFRDGALPLRPLPRPLPRPPLPELF